MPARAKCRVALVMSCSTCTYHDLLSLWLSLFQKPRPRSGVISRSGKPLVQAGTARVPPERGWLLRGMLACQKRPRERGFDSEMASPSMEPTCSPNRMLVFESPTSKRTRLMGQQSVAAGEERGGPSCSPFQSFASADAAGNTRPARPPPPRRPIPPSVSFPAPPAQSAAARGHGVAGRTRAHHSPCRASVATLLAHGASVAARATDRALTPSLPRLQVTPPPRMRRCGTIERGHRRPGPEPTARCSASSRCATS